MGKNLHRVYGEGFVFGSLVGRKMENYSIGKKKDNTTGKHEKM